MMSSLIRRALAGLAFAILLGLLLPALANPGDDNKARGKVGADLALVPHDTLWFTTLRVGDLVSDKAFKKLLAPGGETMVQGIEKQFGVKADAVERITLVVRRMRSEPISILHMTKPYDKDAFLKRLGRTAEAKVHGKTIVLGEFQPGFGTARAVWMPDDRTIVRGTPEALVPYLAALSRGGKMHPFADEQKIASGKHTVVVAMRPTMMLRSFDAEMLRSFHAESRVRGGPQAKSKKSSNEAPAKGGSEKQEPPPFDPTLIKEEPLKLRSLDQISDTSESWVMPMMMPAPYTSDLFMVTPALMPAYYPRRALLTIDLGDGIEAKARADFDSEEEVKDAEVVTRMGLYLLRETFPRLLRREMGPNVKAKGFATMAKQFKDAVRAIEIHRDGKSLKATGKAKIDLAPLFKYVGEEAPTRAGENNLKQIGVTFHNYQGTMGYLPQAALCDAAGKPLLSWRVAILPYIEQQELYRQFKLDEAWDSPHNKKLISKMPKIYAPPVGKVDGPNVTFYQVLTGPNTLYPRPNSRPTIPASITDGISLTLLVVEASKAVPWTKPEDIVVPAKGNLPKFGGQFRTFFNALLCDGTVLRIRRDFDQDVLRAAITPAGGEVFDLGKLKP